MMNITIKKIALIFKMIYQTIIKHPFKTLMMMVGIMGVALTVLLSLSVKPFLEKYEYNRVYQKYGDIDLTMSVGPYSQARFFSISPLLNDSYFVNNEDVDYVPFFEFDVLIDNSKDFVRVFSSKNEYLSKLFVDIEPLKSDEIMITKSLSLSLNKNQGDLFKLKVGDDTISYTIRHIVEDQTIFTGDSVYIDKEVGLVSFLKILEPAIADWPNRILNNIYNRVYFMTPDNQIDETYDHIKAIMAYESLVVDKTLNSERINQRIEETFPIFLIVIFGLGILMLLVFQTSLNLYFEEKRTTFRIFNILGASKAFSLFYVMIEMLSLITVSYFIALLIGNSVFKYGTSVLSSSFVYRLSIGHKLLTAMMMAIFFVCAYLFYHFKYFKSKSLSSQKDMSHKAHHFSKTKCIMLIMMLISYIILLFNQHLKTSVVRIILVFGIVYLSLPLLFILLYKAINQLFKDKLISFKYKITALSKQYLNFNYVFLIALVSCMFIIGTQLTINEGVDSQPEFYQIDYALINYHQSIEGFEAQVQDIPGVTQVLKVNLYQETYLLIDGDVNLLHHIVASDDPEVKTFFDVTIDDNVIKKLGDEEKNKIIIHQTFSKIYNLEVGQIIDVSLGDGRIQSLEIVGFYNGYSKWLAITNYRYENQAFDTLIIQTRSEDKANVHTMLLDQYGTDMIKIVDYERSVTEQVSNLKYMINFLSYILIIVFSCFVLTLLNHVVLLLNTVKKDNDKLSVLGANKKTLANQFYLINSLTGILVVGLSVIGLILIKDEMLNLTLLFKQYQPLTNNGMVYVFGMIFGIVMMVIIQSFYHFYMHYHKAK